MCKFSHSRATQTMLKHDEQCQFQVNQKLLLEDLYESRQCNRLLETETTEEAWPSSVDDRGRQNSQFDAGEAYEVKCLNFKLFVRLMFTFVVRSSLLCNNFIFLSYFRSRFWRPTLTSDSSQAPFLAHLQFGKLTFLSTHESSKPRVGIMVAPLLYTP